MGRSPCCSKEGLNKGAWTAQEDKILTEYVRIHGEGQWGKLPKRAGKIHIHIYIYIYRVANKKSAFLSFSFKEGRASLEFRILVRTYVQS